jgi:two-component system chemotaxis response regulator CheY
MADIDYEQKLRFLVIDDVAVYRFLMESGIKKVNPFIQMDQAATVEEAMEKLTQEHYNAVISDWNMPEGGGEALLKWMRARPHFRKVPFIMISGKSDNEDIIEAFMRLGVDAYVVKPFNHRDLYEKVMGAIANRSLPASN